MKPFKASIPLSRWLLRISLVALMFFYYFSAFNSFNLKSPEFYFAAVYIVFGSLLFIGGFMSKSSLTVISALIIFILSVYMLIVKFTGITDRNIIVYFLPASLSFYFLSTGNDH